MRTFFLYKAAVWSINKTSGFSQEGNPKRGSIWVQRADSLCCTVESNTTLKSNYIPIKINLQNNDNNKKSWGSIFFSKMKQSAIYARHFLFAMTPCLDAKNLRDSKEAKSF